MSDKHDLRLARALDQLTVYFEALLLPFSLIDLYILTYGDLWHEMPGALWLPHLEGDLAVRMGRDEFYTLHTIMSTLHDAGLGLLLDQLEEETAKLGIRVGMMRIHVPKRPPDYDL